MSKLSRILIPTAFIALPLLNASTGAAEGEVVDMTTYLCKDVMRMSGEERSVALGVLHGYALGKKGATSFLSEKLHKLTSDFTEYCLDNPQEQALAAFEKLAN